MTYAERFPKTLYPADALRRFVAAILSKDEIVERMRLSSVRRHLGGGLDAGTLRDIGASREYQDYVSSATMTAGPDRLLSGQLSRFYIESLPNPG